MVELIAEIAQGYEGHPKQAELLARGAVMAGADTVKFQLVYADELATPDYKYYRLFKSLEMPGEAWKAVADIVHGAGRRLAFDVFGFRSLQTALELRANAIKLSTTEFYNHALLAKTLESKADIFLSIGGIPVEDIDELLPRLPLEARNRICLMYGFQAEPTPLEQNNLARLTSLRQRYQGFKFGFMDHSQGGASEDATMLSLMSLTTGVSVIEKHMTLDYALALEDYVSAISPAQFAEFARIIRKFAPAVGMSGLKLTPLEIEYAAKATKVVVAAQDLQAGSVLQETDVALKRVGDTQADAKPYRSLSQVIGRRLTNAVHKDEAITGHLN